MMGRALLTAVGLIIAAGLLLPVYAPDSAGPGPAPSDVALLVAAAVPADCPDCAPAAAGEAACQPTCPCAHLLTTADEAAENSGGEIVYLVVQPRPSDRMSGPRPLPPKLPAV